MQVKSIVLGKQSKELDFVSALRSCEKNKKIPPGCVDYNRIKFLLKIPAYSEATRVRNSDLEARQIKKALQEAQKAVIVDASSLENALAIINEYKGCWNITDDVIEKLFMVVYDTENPDRAEIIQNIKEAFNLLHKFDQEKKVLFVTAEGHVYNFAMDLAARKNRLGCELPEFNKIVEIKPEDAFSFIRSAVMGGKTVFVHEILLNRNPSMGLLPSSLPGNKRDKLNFVKARKKKI